MSSTWWPSWLGIAFSATVILILAVHVGHAVSMSAWCRLWHGSHVLAALGMLDMAWPGPHVSVASIVWVNVYCAGCLSLLIVSLLPRLRRGTPASPWLTAAFDLGGMAYMFAMTAAGHELVTSALVACFLVESAAWVAGVLRTPDQDGGVPQPSPGGSVPRARSAVAAPLTSPGAIATAWSTRISLAAMGVGMAYMLLAMQFGMPDMSPRAPAGSGHHHHVGALWRAPESPRDDPHAPSPDAHFYRL